MNCFYHENKTSVATCQVCGKGLCKLCASKYRPCMCTDCYDIEYKELKNGLVNHTSTEMGMAILKGVIFAILLPLVINGFDLPFSGNIFFCFCVPFAWEAVSDLERKSSFGILMNPMFFLFYFVFKFAFCMLLGVPIFIIKLLTWIVELKKAQNI